ncbi:MAG TPA: chaperone modulator CbpM [Chloroflexota bacterium]|nr:chaperone modulator CbpM [Chloroflexota bacterium]
MSSRYYRVEVVCEQLEIPRAQLRRYEQLGLIAPSGAPEQESASPRYTDEDLRRLRRIRRMQRDLGLNLAGLQVALRLLDQIADLQRRLEERK